MRSTDDKETIEPQINIKWLHELTKNNKWIIVITMQNWEEITHYKESLLILTWTNKPGTYTYTRTWQDTKKSWTKKLNRKPNGQLKNATCDIEEHNMRYRRTQHEIWKNTTWDIEDHKMRHRRTQQIYIEEHNMRLVLILKQTHWTLRQEKWRNDKIVQRAWS